MFGIRSDTQRDFSEREKKLQEIKRNNREVLELSDKLNEHATILEAYGQNLKEIYESIKELRKEVFGEPDDDELVTGVINGLRNRLDEQRDEYYALIEKYMNELDRKKLEEIEGRIKKLEEGKSKFNIVSSSTLQKTSSTLELKDKTKK